MTNQAPKASVTGRGGPSRVRGVLLVVGILLLAANLRPALTALPPLIGEVRADTGVSNGVAGLLTTLPLLAFGLLSPGAPRLARRIGMERALLASLLVLAAGILVRSAGPVALLFVGTAVLGAAIAVGNVLLPGLVKREFPDRAGLATSVYSTAMGVAAALAAGASFPISQQTGLGWRASLALLAVPAVLAAVAWLPLVRGGGSAKASDRDSRGISLWRSPLAWQVTLFMGLQSLAYYVTLTWLPLILRETAGLSAAQAGWMLALAQAVGIASMFLAPLLAGRTPSQRGVLVASVALSGAGTLGLLVSPGAATALWVVLIGLGQGACFSLALTFFALRAPDPEHAAALSGMAQSVGYLLAAVGPFLFGVLRDATHAWTVPLALLLAIVSCLMGTGLGAARDAKVASPPVSRE
ncbi:MAG TPA: MFS transporter [Rubrobacteraceae bacterium]|nr:MFS transporter [Rubrobacteraceae bacterium]